MTAPKKRVLLEQHVFETRGPPIYFPNTTHALNSHTTPDCRGLHSLACGPCIPVPTLYYRRQFVIKPSPRLSARMPQPVRTPLNTHTWCLLSSSARPSLLLARAFVCVRAVTRVSQFVILAAFDHTDPALPVGERVALGLKRCGLSVTCKLSIEIYLDTLGGVFPKIPRLSITRRKLTSISGRGMFCGGYIYLL